jgi:prophage tail gpP-like protein
MILKVKRHFAVDFFNKTEIELRYDSVASTFSFQLYFDPKNEQHRVLWQPGHFHVVDIIDGNDLLVRGFVLSQKMTSKAVKQLSSISGYSLPGVLEDCQIPPEIYPLQSDGQTLRQITQKILGHFTQKNSPINLEVDPAVLDKVNSVFEKTTASETETVKSYLTKMAAQKNIILSHTPQGNLLYTEAKTKSQPIFHFTEATAGVISMELTFNGQPMHSTITMMKQASTEGGNAGQATTRNPYVPFVKRPKVATQSSGTDNETADAGRNALAAELKNIKLVITTSTNRIKGTLIKPNNIITATNPEIYLFNRTDWFIESVKHTNDETKETAVLTCVLPAVYDNSIKVVNIFEEMEIKAKPHG